MIDDYLQEAQKLALISEVNNEISLYHATGDARFFWRAYRRLHKAGEPIPQSYLDKFAEYAERILLNDDLSALPAALELAGTDKAHIGPKQSASYRRRWRLASEVEIVKDLYKIGITDAINIVANNHKMSFAKVKKAHWEIFNKPAAKGRAAAAEDAGALLQKLWR